MKYPALVLLFLLSLYPSIAAEGIEGGEGAQSFDYLVPRIEYSSELKSYIVNFGRFWLNPNRTLSLGTNIFPCGIITEDGQILWVQNFIVDGVRLLGHVAFKAGSKNAGKSWMGLTGLPNSYLEYRLSRRVKISTGVRTSFLFYNTKTNPAERHETGIWVSPKFGLDFKHGSGWWNIYVLHESFLGFKGGRKNQGWGIGISVYEGLFR